MNWRSIPPSSFGARQTSSDGTGAMNERRTHAWPTEPGFDPRLDARQHAAILLWNFEAGDAHLRAQVAVLVVGVVRELVRHQDVDLRALVVLDILLGIAVAKVDHRAVLELELVLDRAIFHRAGLQIIAQHPEEARRPLQVVAAKVRQLSTEEVDLNSRHLQRPADR
jgi:hypothetical protein